MKKISVCIPTYNGSKYIKDQLLSILGQLHPDDEIIISDDSSTDNTLEIIKSLNDKRIKVLKNNCFKSPIYNLENALKQASGDYIFTADQDDIWMPQKVNIMVQQLSSVNLVVSDCIVVDSDEKVISESFYKLNQSKAGLLNNIIKNSFLGCCMAFDRKILNYVLPFPEKIAMHDIWIGLNAEVIGKTKFISDKLIYYRRHGENFSFTSDKSKFGLFYKIQYRLVFVYQLILRRIAR